MNVDAKIVVILGLIGGTLAGCQYAAAGCWPELRDAHNRFWLKITADDVESTVFEVSRSELADALRTCSPNETFAVKGSVTENIFNSKITLLDLAIMADDVAMTEALFARVDADGNLDIDPTNLDYGGEYLEIGAASESADVVDWLLEHGFDPNRPNDLGATALHVNRVKTKNGLQVTRDLVAYGADIEKRAQRNVTPLMVARNTGDLKKVQCLLALGALVPDESEYAEVDVEESRRDQVQRVDNFLGSEDRVIPKSILDICSLDSLGHGRIDE